MDIEELKVLVNKAHRQALDRKAKLSNARTRIELEIKHKESGRAEAFSALMGALDGQSGYLNILAGVTE